MTGETSGAGSAPLKVWDGSIRLFHWALVLLFAIMWWTGDQRRFDWHFIAGYCLLGLLIFRLAWGLVGSQTARFGSFMRGPVAVGSYVRGLLGGQEPPVSAGHNPLGGWSAILMLLLLSLQLALGLVAVDVDGIESGPLSYLVEFDTGRAAAELHALLFDILLAVIALHILAVAFYLFRRRENLVGAMISGRKAWRGERPALSFASPLRALFALSASAGLAAGFYLCFGA